MIILKELILSLIVGGGLSGIIAVLFINNPKTWYKTAKKIKQLLSEEKRKKK